ncbi:MAG: hypothetical protein WAK00_03095 [Microbacterium sp.]|uniref:hypothetical protein n=1 Tax=Microbacterium sp. TaxID=51671 RepID=UPI003BAF67C5
MTSTIVTSPVDDGGELVHAEDATSQLCLAFVRLEQAMSERGLPVTALVGLRLRTTVADPVAELVELVAERLDGVRPTVTVEIMRDDGPVVPGLLVRLEATVADAGSTANPPIHSTEPPN